MDDIEKRTQQLWAKAEAITPSGPARGDDPRPWQYRADILWLLTQLEASRQECERLRGALMDARRDEGYP